MFGNAPAPSGEIPSGDLDEAFVEQRKAHRIHTVCRFAKVTSRDDEGLWRLCNISDHGVMFRSHGALTAGEPISILLSQSVTLEAETVWSDGERCGARFDTEIDSAAMLCALALEQQLPSHRPLRLAVDRRALAFDETGLHSVRVRDLSRYGVGLCHRGRLHPGIAVKLRFESGAEHRGVVRWADREQAGLRLLDPLAPAELASAGRRAPRPGY